VRVMRLQAGSIATVLSIILINSSGTVNTLSRAIASSQAGQIFIPDKIPFNAGTHTEFGAGIGNYFRAAKKASTLPPFRLKDNSPRRRFHLQLSCSLVDPFYSYRRATSGSTFAARRAGNQQAISVTSVSNEPVTINVNGSLSLIP
jgi:hypothetical protein